LPAVSGLLTALDDAVEEELRWAERRAEAKGQVIRALIDGRLVFQQAVARFQAIDAEGGGQARRWRPPEYTEQEWPYRQVISAVHTEFAHRRRAPAHAEEWVARLEAELRECLLPEQRPVAGRGGVAAQGMEGRSTPAAGRRPDAAPTPP
jgi:hypothetical protein